jgi:hypothetical protein
MYMFEDLLIQIAGHFAVIDTEGPVFVLQLYVAALILQNGICPVGFRQSIHLDIKESITAEFHCTIIVLVPFHMKGVKYHWTSFDLPVK